MGKLSKGTKPNRIGGGRSDRYEERHVARGSAGTNAPEWSDAAAREILRELHAAAMAAGHRITAHTMWVLDRLERIKELIERTKSKLGPHDREIARSCRSTWQG